MIPNIFPTLLQRVACLYTESTTNFNVANYSLTNADQLGKDISLRTSADTSGLINFNEKNHMENYSFEFKVNRPFIHYPETLGVYVYLTENKIKPGDFHGSDGEFHGLVAGLEQTGAGVHLVLGHNDGSMTLEKEHTDLLLKDNINPERFRDVEQIKFKVINTSNNFKIELYDQKDRLLYDKLRFTDVKSLGDLSKFNFISIGSQARSASHEHDIKVSEFKLRGRTETDEYVPGKSLAQELSKTPRSYEEINADSKEIQHLISNLEHFMAYIKLLLGDTNGVSINKAVTDLKLTNLENKKSLEKFGEEIDEVKHLVDSNSLSNLSNMLNQISTEITELNRGMVEVRHQIHVMERRNGVSFRSILCVIVIVGLIGVLINYLTKKDSKLKNY